ncbi:NAD-specific glutamate dehydrogenase [Tsukamurella strandjordii]
MLVVGVVDVVEEHRLELLAGDLVAVAVLVLADDLLPVELDRVQRAQRLPQLVEVPVLHVAGGGGAVHVGRDHVVGHVVDLVEQVSAREDLAALVVDHLALLVLHVVVLEHVLTDLEVLLLHLRLRAADGAGDELVVDRHVVGQVDAVHPRLDLRAVEAPHQLVAQREVEAGLARIALAAGAAAQLVVDAPRLVPLGAQHVQAAGFAHVLGVGLGLLLDLLDGLVPRRLVLLRRGHRVEAALAQLQVGDDVGVAAQHHVGAAAGHVGGHRDRAGRARLGDDRRLLLVELRVEHGVRDLPLLQLPRQVLRPLHRGGTDQHRLARLVPLGDVVDDRRELRLLGLVDEVGLVLADHRLVRGDRDDAQLVDLVQLGGLGLGGAGHARELVVEPEVVLQRDGGQRLVLGLDLDVLLRLQGLVHALVEAAAREHAAGELVDDEHLTGADDVVLVALVELLGLDRVVEVAHQQRVGRVVEVVDAQLILDQLHAGLVHADRLLPDVHLVVDVLVHLRHDPGELGVPLAGAVRGARDDQRGAGLVDEDRVDLVDDGVVVAALHQFLDAVRHVVAQVVEAELVVGAVGDVGGVGLAAAVRVLAGQDAVHLEAEEAVHAAHPVGVALGEVVVRGHQVHALAGQRVEVRGHHGGQGLALTGLHLGDVALVQGARTHDLHVVRLLPEHAPGRLTGGREGLGEDVVEGLAVVESLLELGGLGLEFLVGERLVLVVQALHVGGQTVEPLDHPAFAESQHLGENH